jgi:dTDP-glucose 4,6-dehydratase
MDSSKLEALGWKPEFDAEGAILDAVRWYVENPGWWQPIKSGEFRKFYERQYGERLAEAGEAG